LAKRGAKKNPGKESGKGKEWVKKNMKGKRS